VWVPEWHKSGDRLHAHFAVGRYVQRSLIEQAWGRGFVNIKLLGNLPVGSSTWHEARKAAGYLSKYVTKTFDPAMATQPGLHRYDVAQGFQPTSRRLTGHTSGEVLAQACELMARRPAHQWTSDQSEGWRGPPAMWFAWD
jgi:hypothetical protein